MSWKGCSSVQMINSRLGMMTVEILGCQWHHLKFVGLVHYFCDEFEVKIVGNLNSFTFEAGNLGINLRLGQVDIE